MRKRSKKVRPVFFVFKFWQDKLSDFSRRDSSNLLPSGILFAPVEFQSSFQVLNFVGILLSRGNLALITRDPFQLLKGLLKILFCEGS